MLAATFSPLSFVGLPRDAAYDNYHLYLAILLIPLVVVPLVGCRQGKEHRWFAIRGSTLQNPPAGHRDTLRISGRWAKPTLRTPPK